MNNSIILLGLNTRTRILRTLGLTVDIETLDLNFETLDPIGVNKTAFVNTLDLVLDPQEIVTSQTPIGGPTSDSVLRFVSYDTTRQALLYDPPNRDNSVAYPLHICFHGDGGKGVVSSRTASLGTGDGSTKTFTGFFDNTGSTKDKILHSSVVVKKAGTQVAAGDINANVVGSGVSGSFNLTPVVGSGSAITVTFSVAPTVGQAITAEAQSSTIFETGYTKILNEGDQPSNVYVIAPQIPTSQTGFNETTFDKVLATLDSLGYNYDPNRIHVSGLSRGAFEVVLLMQKRQSQIASFLVLAGTYGSSANYDFPTLLNKGIWWHQGTNDNTVTNTSQGLLQGGNVYDFTSPLWTTNYLGLDHVEAMWNGKVYSRKERTDATGTSVFDFFRWNSKYSLDQEEQATGHVEYAEYYLTIQDYRLALIQVNLLSSGSVKTDLLTRLATVKSTVDAGGKRYIVDFGVSTNPSTGNYNNITNGATNQQITNLVDDEGGSSTITCKIDSQFTTSATKQALIANSRGRGYYFGFPNRDTYIDIFTLSTTVTTGALEFSGLDNSKLYNIRIYHCFTAGNFSAESTIKVVINGVTKTQYSEANNTEFLEFTNLSPASGVISISIGCNTTARNSGLNVIELFKKA